MLLDWCEHESQLIAESGSQALAEVVVAFQGAGSLLERLRISGSEKSSEKLNRCTMRRVGTVTTCINLSTRACARACERYVYVSGHSPNTVKMTYLDLLGKSQIEGSGYPMRRADGLALEIMAMNARKLRFRVEAFKESCAVVEHVREVLGKTMISSLLILYYNNSARMLLRLLWRMWRIKTNFSPVCARRRRKEMFGIILHMFHGQYLSLKVDLVSCMALFAMWRGRAHLGIIG